MAYAKSTIATISQVAARPAMREQGFLQGVEDIAKQYNIPADWILMVMLGESGLSPAERSSSGAVGLMQWLEKTAFAEIAQKVGRTYTAAQVQRMTAVQQLAVVRDWIRVLSNIAGGRIQSFWHLYLLNFLPYQAHKWNSDFSIANQGTVSCQGQTHMLTRWRAFIEFKTCRLRDAYRVTAPLPPAFMTAAAPSVGNPVSSAPVGNIRPVSLTAAIVPLPTLNPVPLPVVAVSATPLQQRSGFFSWFSNLFSSRRSTMSAFAGEPPNNNPNQETTRTCFILLTFCFSALLLFAVLSKESR
ncbi:transglycosylase SLT domain-containing protein [Rhodoflexus caldus]|uniref:transglycosylase SLT domain-containing protein n=1 Tax=Rhodoflexus caldus TaxID=2891236 RepID=UPI00202A4713|nr:transglycosylase SLT domain-containing protein [Rhodoflexus caldus]